ncbi:unnamed protein product [Prorocentrum cordatum]|uniref:Ubiquitin-like domain-containing protein n=1 Tax=Prorocentrum cordatum TaxID=2364126 RepID=A0ABN9W7K2_9DINO|nr:unnamed protein product [Polarella glacialis]
MAMRLAIAAAPGAHGACAAPLAVEVEAADTVAMLKGRVRDREGILEAEQRLLYNGKQLEDSRQLSDYNLVDGAEIVLVRRLPAASAAKLAAIYGERRPRTRPGSAAGRPSEAAPGSAAAEKTPPPPTLAAPLAKQPQQQPAPWAQPRVPPLQGCSGGASLFAYRATNSGGVLSVFSCAVLNQPTCVRRVWYALSAAV